MAAGPDRLLWLDLARGTAIVFMVLAHTWPWGGLWAVVEYVTAPWFALLIGVSLSLVWQKRRTQPALFLFDSFVRGVLLILLGIGLQGLYGQIVVVLQTWGALIILLAPLLWLIGGRPWLALLVSATLAVVSPLLMGAGREWIAGAGYSIADMAAYPWIDAYDKAPLDLTPFPHVRRWRAAIAGRPATARAYALARQVNPNADQPLSDEEKKILFGQGVR